MAREKFRQLLRTQEISNERTRLYRLGNHLRKRLAQVLEALPQNSATNMESQTDRINRLLVLWLDLQAAVRKRGRTKVLPWESNDEQVARLWSKITDPRNACALEEWLFQVAPGELELWAQQALLECRRRKKA